MLKPTDRRLLFELLRPPADYRLSCAVGTTYSLDLLALLVTPLAFTLFDWETKEGRLTASPLALLESLRRYADRVTVFCQSSAIHPPTKARELFGYLEGCVVEVNVSESGVFHPKLWALRFEPTSETADDELPILYRLLCPSRNLTFDRSWDTMLALEGTYRPEADEQPQNRPLANFFARLPHWAVRKTVSASAHAHSELVSSEIAKVVFEPPKGFDEIRFWPLGIDEPAAWPFAGTHDRLLVVSPFVSDQCLTHLADKSTTTLISRAEEMMRLRPETLNRLSCFTLDPAAEVDAEAEPVTGEPVELAADGHSVQHQSGIGQEQPEVAVAAASEHLSGLHAKLYVADDGSKGRVWTGSANATNAAFGGNVEILVELVGPRELCGVDAVLGNDENEGLRNLLQPYIPQAEAEVDEVEERLEKILDEAKLAIARQDLRSRVVRSNVDEDLFDISIEAMESPPQQWQSLTHVSCRPVTLGESWQQRFSESPYVVSFSGVHFDRLTSFVLFRIEAALEGRSRLREFVVNLPLQDAPENRRERLLLSLLRNSTALMRYLRLLLADDGWDAQDTLEMLKGFDGVSSTARESEAGMELPLLEPMLMAFTRSPDKLDRIAQLVTDLQKTAEGRALIPAEFYEAWTPIWEVRSS